MNRRRAARAALAGAAAAAAYLGGAKLAEARPVKGTALGLLACAALASAHASVKAASVERRVNDLFAGNVGLTLSGLTLTGNLNMGGHNINSLDTINSDGTNWNSNGGVSFVGPGSKAIWMHGGDIWLQNGAWHA